MFRLILVLTMVLTVSFVPLVQANVGKVSLLKGQSEVERKGEKKPLHQGDEIFEFDVVSTASTSFIRITMNDETVIQLGPEATFKFAKNTDEKGLRQAVYELMKGKLRTVVNKKATAEESIKFTTKSIGLGVRGTEFMANAYMVQGKSTTDVLLLKGRIAADASALGTPVKTFDVSEGQYFNTHQIAQDQGWQSVKTLSSETVKKMLEAGDSFLPDLMNANGVVQDLTSALSSAASTLAAGGAAALGLIGAGIGAATDSTETSTTPTTPAPAAPVVMTKEIVTVIYKEREAPDPVDIREAKEQWKNLHKNNRCFFWFYKIIPGSFTPERFRRERECNEYEFDL